MTYRDVDDFECPHCGRGQDSEFGFGSKPGRNRYFTRNRITWFSVSEDAFRMERLSHGAVMIDRKNKNLPRCATCLACDGVIWFPGPKSSQWKQPLQCVQRAFAKAKAQQKLRAHARTAIQEASP